jgi:ABC-type lipoprotein release transport system permease subunit
MLKVAWRNIWRNWQRTAITGAAIAFNTAFLIVAIALNDGMLRQTIDSITAIVLGQAQVHAPAYRAKRSFYDTIDAPDRILQAADRAGVGAVARAYGSGLVSVGNKSSGARFWGVDARRERVVFDLARQVHSGAYLSDVPPPDARELVLGSKLASSLHAQVGEEVVAVVQASDGSIGNELFVVRGILKTVASNIDRSAAIIHQRDFDVLFSTQHPVHEVALLARDRRRSRAIASVAQAAAPDQEVLTWEELAPAPAKMSELMVVFTAVFGLIFSLAAGMGVMNSMLMSTFDRMREFGVLKALGATPWRIVRDVAAEAFVLTAVFTLLGTAVGFAANVWLHEHGLNIYTGDDLKVAGIAFDPIWRATLDAETILFPAVLMTCVGVLASLYPAIKAARLDPVVAMTEP